MPRGALVILNAGSSAGKTSLGRAMQDLRPECVGVRVSDADAIYDLEVATTRTPPNILAGQLVVQMRTSPPPTALARLRTRFPCSGLTSL